MNHYKIAAVALAGCLAVVSLPVAAQEASPLEGEIYTFDTTHSLLDFTARHAGFARVRGTFKEYRGAIFFVEKDPARSSVTVVVNVASIDTGHPGRDGVLRQEFFNVEKYAVMKFHSERIEKTEGGWTVAGPLTIRDVTRQVRIPLAVVTLDATDQFQHRRIVLTGRLTLNRKDYGVSYSNRFWDNIASEEIEIELEIAARAYNALNTIFPWRENSIGTVIRDLTEPQGVEPARQQVRRLWKEHREDYNFSLSQIYRAGKALAQQGRYADAIKIYELAFELHGESADAKDLATLRAHIAEAQARGGQPAAALESLKQALSLDPENPVAHELQRHLRP